MNRITSSICASILFSLVSSGVEADIIDFHHWSLVQDPPHVHFSGIVDSNSQATLRATGGPVPHATDVGFQSINGSTSASSTSGYAFDPSADFMVAIDFNLTFTSPLGGLGIGFGIGEDADGKNSAGAVLLTKNGSPYPGFFPVFGAAARINDVNQLPQIILVQAQTTGRFIAGYQAATGDVVLGVSTNGDDVPEGIATYAGIQNNWNGGMLFPSFFLRSDNLPGAAWASGTAEADFTNFHVISGSATQLSATAVPEPSSLMLLALGGLGLLGRSRVRQRS